MAEDTGTNEETQDEEKADDDPAVTSFSDEARDKVAALEDDPPSDLKEWPDDEAKYVTLGGSEGDKGWNDGPTKNLGPADVEYQEDGSVTVEGEKVDNPDDFKGEPIPLASEIMDQKAARGKNPERPETGTGPGEDGQDESADS
jgi:hypothetical protein